MAITKGAQPTWIKSSYSAGNGACVEIKSPATHAVDVRDSKDPQGPNLAFAPASWSAFVTEMSRVDV